MRNFFEGTRPGQRVSAGPYSVELPVLYFRDDSFVSVFTVDAEKARRLMPSRNLHPVPATPGRALLVVAAYDYLETSAEPYGEVAITLPVVHGRRPPPFLPLVLSSWAGFGHLVLHLPVTARRERDVGRALWGYAKFVADMAFENTPEWYQCRLSEAEEHVLTLRVAKRGVTRVDRRPLVTYSVKDRALLRATMSQTAIMRTALGAGGSSLELGSAHQVAQALRELKIHTRPVMTAGSLDRSAILPAGEIVEREVAPLDGYAGAERDAGKLSATHLTSRIH